MQYSQNLKKSLNEYGDISSNSLRKIIPTLSGFRFSTIIITNIMEKNINPRLPNKDELKVNFSILETRFYKKKL